MEEKVFRISCGGCALILSGVLSSCICGVFNASVTVNAIVFIVLVLAMAAVFIVYTRRSAPHTDGTKPGIKAEYVVQVLIAAAVVALQIFAVMHYRFENTEAVRKVAVATTVFESGHTVSGDPMMVLLGTWSHIFGIHPLAFIYYAAPVFILLYYLCYLAVIVTLLQGRARFAAFIAVAALNAWGYQSEVLIPATLLISWFGLWVFVIHGLANTAVVLLVRYVRTLPVHEDKAADADSEEDDLEEWDMKNHKIINARNLAIALGVLTIVLIGAVIVLNSKINRLYAATVNLQDDLNKRCGMYEFVPEGKGIEGYLLQGSDGQISFIGGGAADNADDLSEFLARYGSAVDKWYVYGDDDANAGAMKKLVSSGAVSAESVYVITREEFKGIGDN